jgi:hypothetical protein
MLDRLAARWTRVELDRLARWSDAVPPRAIDAGLLDAAIADGIADHAGVTKLFYVLRSMETSP